MARHVSQLRRGVLELAILALLRTGRHYGGAIVEDLSVREGLEAGAGTIYPLLTRLNQAGLVKTSWEESPSGPPRKYYHLTSSGSRHLDEQERVWDAIVTSMTTLLRGEDHDS